ncbi:MAG: hypothetical protein JWP37_357 [Mucilaginibacter sp.]|nr:hypothetical protein [Mucilaginibacter sp.]
MTTIYLVLKISALLLIIVLPLVGPKKKKNKTIVPTELSEWAIDENGLVNYIKVEPDHHTVK